MPCLSCLAHLVVARDADWRKGEYHALTVAALGFFVLRDR